MSKDLTGRKFGRLRVLKRSGSNKFKQAMWECVCSCGKKKRVNGANLRKGRSRSCGCGQADAVRKPIRIGSRFAKLKVLQFSGMENNRSMYLCLCDCGETTTIQAHRIKNGTTTSCGCARKGIRTIIHGLCGTPEYQKACSARRRARKRAAGGSHTAEDILVLRLSQNNRCLYCEKPLSDYHVDHMVPLARGGSNGRENICLACPDCNLKKNVKTAEEFLSLIHP